MFSVGILFSLNSCVTPAYSQDVVITEVDGDVDVKVVLRYGVPYYYDDGTISYYYYNGWYVYPYLYGNNWYFYSYNRPFPIEHGHRFIPRASDRPHHFRRGANQDHRRPMINHRPSHSTPRMGNIHGQRPSVGGHPRSSTYHGGSINRHSGSSMNRGARPSGSFGSRPSGGMGHSRPSGSHGGRR